MISIFIIGPTPALRAGMRALLTHPDIQINGESALALRPLALNNEVIVATGDDLRPLLRELATDNGRSIVVLSNDQQLLPFLAELPLHGWAWLSPDVAADELRAGVFAAAQGLIAFPRELAPPFRHETQIQTNVEAETLTPREHEVLNLLSQGLSNRQIAGQLQISEHTVKFHISAVFAKLGAASRTEAVRIGARQGLITL